MKGVGFDDSFQFAINTNRIEVGFVKLYFSGLSAKVMQDVQNFFKDVKQKETALKECVHKIHQAKIEEEQAARQAEAPETKAAFEK
ncbi:MAG: hypothetical protein HWD61_06055 [Parachlamydiaceae bacterium]|nr:MAG: hypothetical protein HWD61_06055 [Parachlamydiaceae bacterium]